MKREKLLCSPVTMRRAMNKGVFNRFFLAALKYSMAPVLLRALLLLFLFPACQPKASSQASSLQMEAGENKPATAVLHEPGEKALSIHASEQPLLTGAEQPALYLPMLQKKNVGIIVNHSSLVGNTHLVDILLENGIQVKKIFAPEHGFRGMADAGETVKNNIDTRTGLPVISLYGDRKKPSSSDFEGLDIIVFDIQDVGARFYTYISTMSLAMEACAEQGKEFLVLDRPNPNGHYVDGPVLDLVYSSYVGMHPVPVVHGMTVGEYAGMVNGEKWLKNGVRCNLKVITCQNLSHQLAYAPPVKPSPNLPDIKSIYLYPSLCFFEGTIVSVGRGTDRPFQVFGAPEYKGVFPYSFTPESRPGAKTPPQLGVTCYGLDLGIASEAALRNVGFDLLWLVDMYNAYPNKSDFFNEFFTKLAGGPILRLQIETGIPLSEIRKSWEPKLTAFKEMRKKYLLYPE